MKSPLWEKEWKLESWGVHLESGTQKKRDKKFSVKEYAEFFEDLEAYKSRKRSARVYEVDTKDYIRENLMKSVG